jgi:serine/threonine protein kinase
MNMAQRHRLIGEVIADRYRVEELLGEGGMGAVYAAEHLTLKKRVALKVVHQEHAGNAELAERFAREAMATSRIDHPNVISALDFGTLPDGTAFLAVQLVRGPSLTKILMTEGKLHWQRAAEIGAQIADALAAAQIHGIVHRDLKPDNVLLQPLDQGGDLVKVLDFGVAKFTRESKAPDSVRQGREVTQVGVVIGTPGYMAPEQAIGHSADHRSDLYALGVILWESMVGRPLWSAHDLQALVQKQLTEDPPRLREAAEDPRLPEALEGLVANLLARRAEDRPQDPNVVRDVLLNIAHQDVIDIARLRGGSGARLLPMREPSQANTIPKIVLQRPTPSSALSQPASKAPAKSVAPIGLLRSMRRAWLLTLFMATLLGAAVFLVATGQIEIRPHQDALQTVETMAKGLNLPETVVQKVREVQAAQTKTGLPPDLEGAYDKLLSADAKAERTEAANKLLMHQPPEEVPAYVRSVAQLQLGKTCAEKRRELEPIKIIGDARALPALLLLSQKPRGGCGKRHREDCLACLREPLAELIHELEKVQAATPPQP